jgi:cell wall-associated NlpC family hydrolase
MPRARLLLVIAASALACACASTGATPRPFPTPGPRPPAAAPPTREGSRPSPPLPAAPPGARADPATPTVDTYALTGTALTLRGTPYRNGGTDPRGFDCSGFTQYVFAQHGVVLPREVRDQWDLGKPVKAEDVAAGDLVFFTTVAPGASHVGIALGGDEFVHAPSSAGVVRVEHANASYWAPRFVGARRISR